MPRYFFHIENGARTADAEGVILSDDKEAQTQAEVMAGEMLREGSARLWETGQWRVNVVDQRGAAVFTLRLLATNAVA